MTDNKDNHPTKVMALLCNNRLREHFCEKNRNTAQCIPQRNDIMTAPYAINAKL